MLNECYDFQLHVAIMARWFLHLALRIQRNIPSRQKRVSRRKYDEEVLVGDNWFGCIEHVRSSLGCRYGGEGATTPGGGSDLQLGRLLHWRQRRLGSEPQLLGLHSGRRCRHSRRLQRSVRRPHRWAARLPLANRWACFMAWRSGRLGGSLELG